MKKTVLTAEEIAAVILERKEEILNLWAPAVCYVSEASSRPGRTRDGVYTEKIITATMFCPACEQWGETEAKTTKLSAFAVNIVCPYCGKIYTHALIGDKFSLSDMASVYSIMLTHGESTYLARMNINFVYNEKCELDTENSTFKFRVLSYYNPTTKTKTKYVLKHENCTNEALVKTTAQYQTLFPYFYSHMGYKAICQSIDGKPLEFATCFPLASMDKPFAEKKKEIGPIDPPEETEECPHIEYKDIIQISTSTVETNCLTGEETKKARCHICGREWMYSQSTRADNPVLQCPYCGTIANNLLHLRADGGTGAAYFTFITDKEDKAIVKTVVARASADDYSVKTTPRMCFEFYPDGKSKGWFFNYTKKWEEYKYNQSGLDCRIDHFFAGECDGLLKYTGIREVVDCLNKNSKNIYETFSASCNTDLRVFICNALKYKVMEKVAKEGLFEEWQGSMHKSKYYTPIKFNAKADTVYDAFAISKPLLKYYKENKATGDGALTMRTLQDLYALDDTITGHDAWWVDYYRVSLSHLESIKALLPDISISQIISYLERVRLGQMFNPDVSVVQWRDYLDACISIGMDMTDRHVLYPRALKTEHDIVVAKQSFIKSEETEKTFLDAVDKYADLAYHKDDYFIKVPENMESMFEEGRKLNHCCGRYVDDVAKGKAFVLFMRKKAAPDIPFLSIEVYPDMTVHQVRGKNDTPISVLAEKREVRSFLFNWAKMKHLELAIS